MRRYPLRTFFMGLGVAAGVATLVAARSLGTGSEQAMLDKVNRMFGPGSIMIMVRGAGANNDSVSTFKIADLEAIEERLDQVVAWDPMLVLGGRELRSGATSPRREASTTSPGREASATSPRREASATSPRRGASATSPRRGASTTHRNVTIYGHSERAREVWNRGVIAGRFFTADDLATAARVALIGTRIAEALFGGEDPIDQQILLDSLPFRIVGVLEPIGIDPHGMDRDEDVQVPTTTAMRRLLNVDYITGAKVVVDDPAMVEETAEEIAEILRQRHHIAAGEPDDFAIFTPKFVGHMIARSKRVLKVFVPAAAGVVLLVAAIVISIIMLTAVRERIAEVGLRKAVGATEGQISFQFLVEAIIVTLGAGILGMALGAGVVAAVARRMQLPAVITADALALGLVAAVAVGVISGLLPARQAARLDPTSALR